MGARGNVGCEAVPRAVAMGAGLLRLSHVPGLLHCLHIKVSIDGWAWGLGDI